MPRSKAQNQQIREETRQALIEAAMQRFAEHGFAHSSMRQIAQTAGVSTGLSYHYFESKEALLVAVFEHYMFTLSARFAPAMEAEDAASRNQTLLGIMFDILRDEPEHWALFYMMRTQPAIEQVLGEALKEWTTRLRDILTANLREMGHDDPELEAYLLYSLIEGTIQQYLLDPDDYPLDAVAERIIKDYGQPK